MDERLNDEGQAGDKIDDEEERSRSIGIPPDAAASVAKDMAHRGWRKPASDEVESERVEQARASTEREGTS